MQYKFPPNLEGKIITTIDAHTAGEPLRIVLDGLPKIKGDTILAQQKYFRENLDYLRTALVWEPRGHADHYGAILTKPEKEDGDIGVFFIHNEGYSTMCGHAIIALTKVLIDCEILKLNDNTIKFDTPAGRVVATAKLQNGLVDEVSFLNVPSFVYASGESIAVEGIGKVNYDIAFGGAFYAFCDAATLGLKLTEKNHDKIIDYGRRIKNAIVKERPIIHPFEEALSFLYGTIFIDRATDEKNHSRNVCIFAEGELDRSPTGTGLSARAALHFEKNEINLNQLIIIESILGTCMQVEATKTTHFDKYNAVIPKVTGQAYIIGKSDLYIDPKDPLKSGFVFR